MSRLYQEQYFEINVRHFPEKLVAEHDIQFSYTWVKLALQGAGLVKTPQNETRNKESLRWSYQKKV